MTATLSPEKFDEVTEALKDVMDPELGINVVDLGLIYDLAWDDENDALVIHMTLTSAGCPLTDVLEDGIAFAGVSRYPARVKCALLGWMAWKDATAQALSDKNPRNEKEAS